jgi:hypothetical protein
MLEPVSGAAFLRNHAGDVCIALSDPAFVQSDAIVIDRSTLCVFAVFHEAAYYLGSVSQGMAEAFTRKKDVVLSAMRADGTVFELTAPICTRSIGDCSGACCRDA